VEYLNHDTYTDVITFPYAKLPIVEGDIFISIERITENGKVFEVTFQEELHRVMIHGVLHLCGYGDKTEEDKVQMTKKENEALLLGTRMK
jgi:rRNA maturation RNase YbeY